MVLTAWVERCRAWAEGWEGGEEVETVKFGEKARKASWENQSVPI